MVDPGVVRKMADGYYFLSEVTRRVVTSLKFPDVRALNNEILVIAGVNMALINPILHDSLTNAGTIST
jgi:hypothetical protein